MPQAAESGAAFAKLCHTRQPQRWVQSRFPLTPANDCARDRRSCSTLVGSQAAVALSFTDRSKGLGHRFTRMPQIRAERFGALAPIKS
jgi:hypothetical protein